MKYKEFKKELDKYFNDNDEIYPHAGCNCVTFYKIFHGQWGGLIESDPNEDRIPIEFKSRDDDIIRQSVYR